MRLDSTHRGWLAFTVLVTAASVTVYAVYAIRAPEGPKGGSWVGLGFGTVGALVIYFAGFLGVRRRLLLMRIGSMTWWMRGHLWLGMLALLFALLHGAFAFGGPLTTALLVLLILVVVTGMFGMAVQHFVPGVMTSQVAEEHTFEQLDRLRAGLRCDAYELVASACPAMEEAESERETLNTAWSLEPKVPKNVAEAAGQERLKEVYLGVVLPYLRTGTGSVVATASGATMLFDRLRPQVDESLHAVLDGLAGVCESLRQQLRQRRLHRYLHMWLLVHVPLSVALMVLLAVHAVMALYY